MRLIGPSPASVSIGVPARTSAFTLSGNRAANIAEDPVNFEMYVADHGCSEVTVVLGTKIVKTIGVGTDPFGVAFDPKTGFMYVSNTGSGTLTVLNGTKIAITVFLGAPPFGDGVGYDPANGLVYVTGGDPRPVVGGDG